MKISIDENKIVKQKTIDSLSNNKEIYSCTLSGRIKLDKNETEGIYLKFNVAEENKLDYFGFYMYWDSNENKTNLYFMGGKDNIITDCFTSVDENLFEKFDKKKIELFYKDYIKNCIK